MKLFISIIDSKKRNLEKAEKASPQLKAHPITRDGNTVGGLITPSQGRLPVAAEAKSDNDDHQKRRGEEYRTHRPTSMPAPSQQKLPKSNRRPASLLSDSNESLLSSPPPDLSKPFRPSVMSSSSLCGNEPPQLCLEDSLRTTTDTHTKLAVKRKLANSASPSPIKKSSFGSLIAHVQPCASPQVTTSLVGAANHEFDDMPVLDSLSDAVRLSSTSEVNTWLWRLYGWILILINVLTVFL